MQNGDIQVQPGDRLPLIPLSRLKLGADYSLSHNWSVGGSLVLASGSFYRGDESNQNPQLPGYHIVNLRTSYRVNRHFELFAKVQNLFDERYSTFGLYSDPTGVGAPGVPCSLPTPTTPEWTIVSKVLACRGRILAACGLASIRFC